MEKGTMCAVVSEREELFDTAFSRYSPMVYRLAYARCKNRQDAEDVFQDVFIKLVDHLTGFDSEEHLKAWLIRATISTSVNLFKSAWRRYVTHPETLPERSSRNFELSERQLILQDALRKLPEKDRVALYLHYYEDMSAEEIASALNDRPSTIRSRLMRGRRKLKALILQEEAQSHA